jgi:hypothetical protein
MKDLLEEDEKEKAPATAGSENKKLTKTGKSEKKKKTENVAPVAVVAGLREEQARLRKEEEEWRKEETDFCRVWREPIELLENAKGNERKSAFGLRRPWMQEIKETFFLFQQDGGGCGEFGRGTSGTATSSVHRLCCITGQCCASGWWGGRCTGG